MQKHLFAIIPLSTIRVDYELPKKGIWHGIILSCLNSPFYFQTSISSYHISMAMPTETVPDPWSRIMTPCLGSAVFCCFFLSDKGPMCGLELGVATGRCGLWYNGEVSCRGGGVMLWAICGVLWPWPVVGKICYGSNQIVACVGCGLQCPRPFCRGKGHTLLWDADLCRVV